MYMEDKPKIVQIFKFKQDIMEVDKNLYLKNRKNKQEQKLQKMEHIDDEPFKWQQSV